MLRRCLALVAVAGCVVAASPSFAQTRRNSGSGRTTTTTTSSGSSAPAVDPVTGSSAAPASSNSAAPANADPVTGAAPASNSGSSGGGASGPMSSDEAVGRAATPPAESESGDQLLMSHGVDRSIGVRVWVLTIPSFIVEQFAHVEPGWAGATNVAAGPEFVYRTDGLDIVLAGMYVGYQAAAGFFRGANESANATELVTSDLKGIFVTAHFLKGIRFARVFELQIGAGIGVGYVYGNLYRSQAFPTSGTGGFADCNEPGGPTGGNDFYCTRSDNNHFTYDPPTRTAGTRYAEPGIFQGGSVPTIMPWVSLPHVALHIRPIQNLDIRLEGGFAIIGFYGGGAIHFVF